MGAGNPVRTHRNHPVGALRSCTMEKRRMSCGRDTGKDVRSGLHTAHDVDAALEVQSALGTTRFEYT